MNLAKLCTYIQRIAELSIIKIVEEHLTKPNKCKSRNKNKNKKVLNHKPRFQPTEHSPTSPIHFFPENWYPHNHTKHAKRIQKAHVHHDHKKTLNQPSKPQPHNTLNQPSKTTFQPAPSSNIFHKTPLPCLTNQALIIHWNTHTHLHHQLTIIHPNAACPNLHPKLQPTYHNTYHLDQLIKPKQVLHTKPHPLYPLNLPIHTTNTNPHFCTTQWATIR